MTKVIEKHFPDNNTLQGCLPALAGIDMGWKPRSKMYDFTVTSLAY